MIAWRKPQIADSSSVVVRAQLAQLAYQASFHALGRGHWLNSSGIAWIDFMPIANIDISIYPTGNGEWIAESNNEIGPIAFDLTPEKAYHQSLLFLEETDQIPQWDWDQVNFPLSHHPFFNALDKLRVIGEVSHAAEMIFNPDIP